MCYPGQEGILEGNPDIDDIIVVSPKPSTLEIIRLTGRLFRKYDIAITNAADDRVHLYLLFFGKKRVSVTTSDSAAWKRWITYATVLENPKTLHALLRNNHLGNLLGFESRYQVRVPRLESGSHSGENRPGMPASGEAYAVIHPDARLPYKRWTTTGWQSAMYHLETRGIRTYITGGTSAAEHDYIGELLLNAPQSAASVAGSLRFAEVSALIDNSRLYIGVDTVNSHLAAAIGAPTIALFGPESPVRWGPWPKNHAEDVSPWSADGTQKRGNVLIIQGNKSCDTCGQGNCDRRRGRGINCPLMTGISSDQVIDGIHEMLESATAR
jgi:heptosyltransferase-3